jgi:hypothetical protein
MHAQHSVANLRSSSGCTTRTWRIPERKGKNLVKRHHASVNVMVDVTCQVQPTSGDTQQWVRTVHHPEAWVVSVHVGNAETSR